jgi:hypothetical protein
MQTTLVTAAFQGHDQHTIICKTVKSATYWVGKAVSFSIPLTSREMSRPWKDAGERVEEVGERQSRKIFMQHENGITPFSIYCTHAT